MMALPTDVGLYVIRFNTGGYRECFKLAFIEPFEEFARLSYNDTTVSVRLDELSTAIHVNMTTLFKAYVFHTVCKEHTALRILTGNTQVICVRSFTHRIAYNSLLSHSNMCLSLSTSQVWDQLDAALRIVRQYLTPLPPMRSVVIQPSSTRVANSIAAFVEDTANLNIVRIRQLAMHVGQFQHESEWMMPTSRSKTMPRMRGVSLITSRNTHTMQAVNKLCKDSGIAPLSRFLKSSCFMYGKYINDEIVTLLCLSVLNLKRPGSIVVSIEMAVSIDKEHSMSIALNSLKRMLSKRKQKCMIHTQAVQQASVFWSGQLTTSRRASVMTVLLNQFDAQHRIYDDTTDMCLIFG